MFVLKNKIVRAKKDHTCNFCGVEIDKGEKYHLQVIKNDLTYKSIYTWKSHIKCMDIAHKLDMFKDCEDDGLPSDMFWEIIEETYHEMYGESELPRECDELAEIEKLDKVCDYYLKDKIYET